MYDGHTHTHTQKTSYGSKLNSVSKMGAQDCWLTFFFSFFFLLLLSFPQLFSPQLRQQVEGWAERVSELEAEMKRCEVAYSGMMQDVATKDERIMV